MKENKLRIAILSVVVVAAVLLGVNQLNSERAGPPPLHTEVADRGDVAQRIVAHGTIQPIQTVTVGSQVSGNVDAIYVDFNSPVEQGQVIAQIDPSTFIAEVRSAEAELEAAEANLEFARLQWQRVETLRENRIVPPSEVEQATASLRQAEAQLTVRRNALERAQRELDRCTIYAPTNGIVISRNVDVGQTVAASLQAPDLFEIATDLSTMQIHAMVSEADIGQVLEGQRVRFVVDAHRGRDFEGEVVQVRNAPITESNVVHYETIISVDNEERLLKPGMTAEVQIITAEVADVVRVRNTALRARLPDNLIPSDADDYPDSDRRVFVLRGGELVTVPVETGLNDDLNTEVRSGVEPGDTLVVGLSLQAGGQEERRSIFGGNQAQY